MRMFSGHLFAPMLLWFFFSLALKVHIKNLLQNFSKVDSMMKLCPIEASQHRSTTHSFLPKSSQAPSLCCFQIKTPMEKSRQ